VSPSVPWLRASASSGSTTTPIQLSVDAETAVLSSGVYTTDLPITLSFDGRTLTRSVPVTLTLTRPTLSVSAGTLTLGGTNGRDFSAGTVQVSLNTGARSFPVTASGAPVWLVPSWTSNTASATPRALSLGLNEIPASPGANTATVQLSAQVNGDTVTAPVSVSFNRDIQRLFATDNGIALVSMPAWSRLSRTVQLNDNFMRIGTWNATSDQAWLNVTASGSLRGGNLTVTADPAGLAVDQLHTATVTVTSNDGNRAVERIRVGLWVGSAAPSAVRTNTTRSWAQLAADPVRPYVYAHDGGTSVYVYNVFNGNLVATITNVGTALGPMAVASDGGALYVADTTSQRIVPINLTTRTVATPFGDATGTLIASHGLAYGRVNGAGVLMWAGNAGLIVDGTSRVALAPFASSWVYSFSRDGRFMAGINRGISPASIVRVAVDYTTLNGGRLLASSATDSYNDFSPVVSNGRDVALSADGSLVYSASGAPYNFPRYSGSPLRYQGAFAADAYPTSVKVGSDGRVFGASSPSSSPANLWVYTASGSLVTSASANGVRERQFVPSGDATMGLAVTDNASLLFLPVGP
jgi:hypothetical protein